ncbi:MAG: PDDEXK nuclease domain-containing protein [Luteolibacter sp.]|uniref:PDDEXK nuclease domain-containing protein n=1 Tax=Luteolibacter sp. TaxID=1962973 RepID=UPI0032650C7C
MKPKRAAKKTTTKMASRSVVRHEESPVAETNASVVEDDLLVEVRGLIVSTREGVARAVNAGLTMLYWNIGHRIRQEVLNEKRAEYGKRIVHALSGQLEAEFGNGFGARNLFYMLQFAEAFPEPEIVHALRSQLGWTHFRMLLRMDDPLKREFYAEMCRVEKWSTRVMEQKIDSMLYERTGLSKKPDALIRKELKTLRDEDRMTPDLVFRDPYILDFLGLKDTYAEKDLETAILREMENFILEVGAGFAFVARQKRMIIDGEDHHLDLLFYHRSLRRLVAIELKLGDFKAAYKGQMELYLAWLNRHERGEGEEKPIGLILCAGKKDETIELLDMEKDGIRVSSYWTDVLPKEQLRQKLHEAVIHARARLGNQPNAGDE